jgi:SAM-dependent methyltransferase
MKELLRDSLACPVCSQSFTTQNDRLVCQGCAYSVPVEAGKPIFTRPPRNLIPSEKIERRADTGTPWRQANWKFLQQQISRLDADTLFLDVGAGRGDFASLFQNRPYLALDIYPYPEVDFVCDLTQCIPLRRGHFGAVVLMNVLEHVYDSRGFFGALAQLLKPGGALIVAIPFMVKIHQAPVDFVRYTEFALEQLGKEHGLQIETLEGYYDPISLLGEGINNLRWSVLPDVRGPRHYLGRALLYGIQGLAKGMSAVLGPGQSVSPQGMRSKAPVGYQVVYRRPVKE